MFRKALCLIIPILLILSGCAATKQIDKASIVESITVSLEKGKREYTFYLIDDSKKVKSTSIKADSFQDACKLAQDKYIPDVVFEKINLILFDEIVYEDTLLDDIEYISHQADLSPLLYISVSDSETIKKMKKDKEMPEQIRNHIDILKKKENKVHIYALSIFNRIYTGKYSNLYLTFIKNKDEITANSLKIII